ncbi:hypothetical protein LIER_42445 [Lithospermum erythrorhizon]|uniref:Uncharacterized protein n=1 Tax=Lithospermum erythrorhizon TaxID=34254 RepID=A0AAV3RTG3_LITER
MKMISSKILIRMTKRWQRFAAMQKKRILTKRVANYPNEDGYYGTSNTSKADKGQFIVYSFNRRRFKIPICFLNNEIFRHLLKMSEDEFGLPRDGPIVLPIDSQFLNYIISVVKKGVAKDVRDALLVSVDMSRCSLPSLNQERKNEHLLVY